MFTIKGCITGSKKRASLLKYDRWRFFEIFHENKRTFTKMCMRLPLSDMPLIHYRVVIGKDSRHRKT